jgi:magnesium-transporting ATPase (P-type)
LNLALNHSVLTEKTTDGDLNYNASSPDELALVNGARFLGATFECRDEENNINITYRGKSVQYKLLNVIEFDSARKRMTVVVRNNETQEILVLCKGADSTLLPLLKDKKTTQVR